MTEKLRAILEAEGLLSLLDKFNDQRVTDSLLGKLTDSDLKNNLGVEKLGDRMRLLVAFRECVSELEQPSPVASMNASSWVNTPSVEEQVQIIAAEPYLSLPPYEALKQFLKDCGGYDMTLADNVIMFPAEPRFVQDPNAQSQVMSLVVRISQLMLQFYRGQLVSDGAATNETPLQKLGFQHQRELASAVLDSTGKMRPSNNLMQQDFVDFVGGGSQFLLKNDINGQPTGEPLIRNIGDFRVHPAGQEVFNCFVQLCNHRERGPLPSALEKTGKIIEGIFEALDDIGSSLGKI